ncbi:hypothetical protein PtB15_17B343, partial [Puccinia triticina]
MVQVVSQIKELFDLAACRSSTLDLGNRGTRVVELKTSRRNLGPPRHVLTYTTLTYTTLTYTKLTYTKWIN